MEFASFPVFVFEEMKQMQKKPERIDYQVECILMQQISAFIIYPPPQATHNSSFCKINNALPPYLK
jgi:hypothetical protein